MAWSRLLHLHANAHVQLVRQTQRVIRSFVLLQCCCAVNTSQLGMGQYLAVSEQHL